MRLAVQRSLLWRSIWASLPITLLIVGIGHLRVAVPGWRWPTAWAGTVAAGIALDPLCLAALSPFDTHPWHGLALSGAFIAVGAAMIAVVMGAARRSAMVGVDRG
jgi:hypothetical protein